MTSFNQQSSSQPTVPPPPGFTPIGRQPGGSSMGTPQGSSPPPPPEGFFKADEVPEGEFAFMARRVHPNAYIPEYMKEEVGALRATGLTPGNADKWAALHIGQENRRREEEGKDNMPPGVQLAIQDIYKRLSGREDLSSQNFYDDIRQRQVDERGNELGGRVQDAASAFAGNFANTGLDIMGTVAPETANQLSQATDEQYRTGQAYDNAFNPANAGNLAAEAVKLATIARAGPVGMAGVYGAQGGGGQRREVAELRDQGEDISGLNEALTSFGVGATEAVSGYVGGRIFRSMGNVLKRATPQFQEAVQRGFRPAVAEAMRQTALVSGHALAEGTEEAATQAVVNVIRQGVNPEVAISEGLAESFTMGVLLSPFGAGNIDAGRGRGPDAGDGVVGEQAPAGTGAVEADPAQLAKEFENRIQRRLAEAQGPDDVDGPQVSQPEPDANTDPTRTAEQAQEPAVPSTPPGEGPAMAPEAPLGAAGAQQAGIPGVSEPSVVPEAEATTGPAEIQARETASEGVTGQGPLTAQEAGVLAARADPDVVAGEMDESLAAEFYSQELQRLQHGDQPFETVDVPIDMIREQRNYQPGQVEAYSQMDPATAPPAVGGMTERGDFALVDGNTRARAARARGEATVRAYVPAPTAEAIRQAASLQQGSATAVPPTGERAPAQPVVEMPQGGDRESQVRRNLMQGVDDAGNPLTMETRQALTRELADLQDQAQPQQQEGPGMMKGIFKQEAAPEDMPALQQPRPAPARQQPTTKADRDDAKIRAKFADTKSMSMFPEEGTQEQGETEPATDPNEDPNLPDDLLDEMAKLGWESDEAKTRIQAKMGNGEVQRSMMRLPGPELLKLAQAVLGGTPGVKKLPGRPRVLGWFKPDKEGTGDMNINPTLGRNEVLLAKVLAHELGHVIDHVPDAGIDSRPNIISRLKSMREEVKKALGNPVGEVKKELVALTEAWSGEIPKGNSKFSRYRRSDEEIYAEFLSVFLSDPAMAQRKAPKAFEIFMESVNRKPTFADNYIVLQDMLDGKSEEAIAARQADIRGDFKKGNERMQIATEEARSRAQDPWENLLQATLDSATPLMKLEKDDTGSWKGSHIDMASDEYAMVDQETQLTVDKVRSAIKPALDAGIDTGVIGEWLMMNRIVYGDRSRLKDAEKAEELGLDPKDLENREQAYINPRNYGPESAKQNLDAIERTLGEEKSQILKDSMEKFLDLPYQMAEKLHSEGAMRDSTFELIEANRGNYVTFLVLDYVDAKVPASIRKQIGTFKPIANPLVSTTMKMMSQARLYETQKYKNEVVKRLQQSGELKKLRVPPGGTPPAPPQYMDNFMHLVNGKPAWFQAHERFVKSLERKNIGDLSLMNQLASKYTYNIFHKVFVQLNMSWMIANLPRDFMRTYKNLKGIDRSITFGELLKAYVKSVKPAYLKERGILTEEVQALLENRSLAALQMGELQKARDTGEYEDLLVEEFGGVKKARKGLLKQIAGLQDVLITLGNTTESMSKIAGEKVLMGRISDSKARAHIIRNKVGTPNIYRKGTVSSLTNTVFMYSKVAISGWRADFDSAFSKETAGGWWEGHMRFIGIPRIMMWMAANGFLGELLEEWFDKIPDYDKTNYLIVPMGESTDGKVRYMRIPMDHTDLLVSGAMWRMMDTMRQEEDDSFEKDMKDMAHFFKSQVPGFSPPIEIANAWTQYATGANPYDSWQRRPIMSPDERRAGGNYAFNSMVQWTADQFGIASQVLDVIPHFNDSQGSSAPRVVNFFPGMSRFIRESDQGLDQERWNREEVEEAESARFRLGLPDGVRDILQERNRLIRFSGGDEKSDLSRQEKAAKAIYNDFYSDYLMLTDAIKVSEANGEQERSGRLRKRLGDLATKIQERAEALGDSQ